MLTIAHGACALRNSCIVRTDHGHVAEALELGDSADMIGMMVSE